MGSSVASETTGTSRAILKRTANPSVAGTIPRTRPTVTVAPPITGIIEGRVVRRYERTSAKRVLKKPKPTNKREPPTVYSFTSVDLIFIVSPIVF